MGKDANGRWSFLSLNNLEIDPPITTNSVKNYDPIDIQDDASKTHIVVHHRFPSLIEDFLEHKRQHGSSHEKALYADAKTFTWRQEVRRLIEKRALVFMGATDYTVLRNGAVLGGDGRQEWDRNGTDNQHHNTHLTLREYLSYDEIMLSSLIGVSGPSFFINDGSRFNSGRPGPDGSFEPRGIIIGLVGARFERKDRMDSLHILQQKGQPSPQDARVVSEMIQSGFYGVAKAPSETAFDAVMYRARIRITAEIFLLEANARASEVGRTAYAYAVGLGLGVWQTDAEQPELYVEAFASAVEELELPCVSTLDFAWIPGVVSDAMRRRATVAGRERGIRVVFSRRNPAEKLDGKDELLVLSYAWDGNAFPGNEYWMGSLCGSGDPAAACMSTVAELHNPMINCEFVTRIEVLGSK